MKLWKSNCITSFHPLQVGGWTDMEGCIDRQRTGVLACGQFSQFEALESSGLVVFRLHCADQCARDQGAFGPNFEAAPEAGVVDMNET